MSTWQWTPDDSKDLDNQVRAYRRADKVQRSAPAMAKAQFTREQRAKADKAERERRLPVPQQKANGRWRAAVVINGKRVKGTFDTRHQAEQFIRNQLKEGK